jgi:hypothetical protein
LKKEEEEKFIFSIEKDKSEEWEKIDNQQDLKIIKDIRKMMIKIQKLQDHFVNQCLFQKR